MIALRRRLYSVREDERGFTLPELLVTIAILGILITIAVILFLGILEQRRVDAATRQLVTDMRLAHTSATNQLTDWRVVLSPGDREYRLVKLQTTYVGGPTVPPVVETIERSLPEGTKVLSTTANPSSATPYIEFNSQGTIHVVSGPNGHVMVSSTDGEPRNKVSYRSATSRITIQP